MRVYSFSSFVWSERQSKYILVRDQSINWTAEVALLKGATAQQTAAQQQSVDLSNTMAQDYAKQFEGQQAILGSLNKALSPIISAGPSQFGYSNGQVNALNSTAIQGTGQQYANASKALKENQAAQGGGTQLLPSGAANQQQAGLASASANQASNELLGIQNAGWQQGNTNYNNAMGEELSAAGLYNPTSYSGQAISANGNAASEANSIQQANAAASPWGAIGGLLGGLGSSFLGGFGGSLGKSLGSSGGAVSGSSQSFGPASMGGWA